METATIWLKVAHISAILVWSATLFYLPGLFAAHQRRTGEAFRRLRLMTRFTYLAVASPAAVIAIVSGTALIYVAQAHGGWLVLKLTAVALMMMAHIACGKLVDLLSDGRTTWPMMAQWGLLAPPALLVPIILFLVLGKPL